MSDYVLDRWIWVVVGVALGCLLGAMIMGCGPHRAKHYRSRGQASHYPNCRPKCPAHTAWDWHERRRS